MERSPGRGSEGYHSTCTCRRSHSRSSSSLRSSSSSSLRLSLCLCSKARELLMAMAASATDPEHNKQNGRRHGPSSSQLKAAPYRRRRLLSHLLHVQVPVPTSSSGCPGRPSGPASAPCDSDPHAKNHVHL